jgi:hypothetical protein
VAALVDGTGAVLVRSLPNGAVELEGVTRGGAVRPWRLALAPGQVPLGCLRCPDVLVSDKSGGLHLASNGVLTTVATPVPLATALGIPGMALTQATSAVATEQSGQLAIHPLGDLAGGAGAALDGPAPRFPLTSFEQQQSALAVTRAGRGVAVARLGALHPGSWRIEESDGSRTVLDVEVAARLTTVEDHVDLAACVSPDGRRVSVVVPDAGGFSILSGAWGRRPQGRHVASTGRVMGCDETPSGPAVAVAEGEQGLLSVYRAGTSGRVVKQRSGVAADSGQFCAGTGIFVTESRTGAAVLRPGTPARRLTTTGLAGCTTDGTIWTVGAKEITWYTQRR